MVSTNVFPTRLPRAYPHSLSRLSCTTTVSSRLIFLVKRGGTLYTYAASSVCTVMLGPFVIGVRFRRIDQRRHNRGEWSMPRIPIIGLITIEPPQGVSELTVTEILLDVIGDPPQLLYLLGRHDDRLIRLI